MDCPTCGAEMTIVLGHNRKGEHESLAEEVREVELVCPECGHAERHDERRRRRGRRR